MNLKIILPVIGVIVAVGIVSAVFLNTDSSSPVVTETLSDLYTSSPLLIASNAYGLVPEVDKNSGTIYLAYVQKHDDVANVYVVRSTDNGKNFGDPVRVNDMDGDATFSGSGGTPKIAVGPSGEVYVQWIKSKNSEEIKKAGFNYGVTTIKFARSLDGGKSFEPSIELESPDDGGFYSKHFHGLTVGPDGIIYSGWLDGRLSAGESERDQATRVARSVDGGKSFEPSVSLDKDPCPCCEVRMATTDDNTLYVSWRNTVPLDSEDPEHSEMRNMVVASSTDGGQTFTAASQINPKPNYSTGCVHVGAPLEIDSKGNIHTTWYVSSMPDPGLYYSISTDGGKTFEQRMPLLKDEWVPPTRGTLAVGENDNIWVAWEDPLTGQGEADDEHWKYEHINGKIQLAFMTPDGKTIKKTLGEGKLPLLAAGNNFAIATWGSGEDVYSRIISLS